MEKNAQIIERVDTSEIKKVAMPEGLLIALPYSYYKQFPFTTLLNFMHENGFYCLPTTELMEWFKANIEGTTIEIGAGNGCIGRSLKVLATDNKIQTWPHIRQYYLTMGQPVITYPEDVVEFDALKAVSFFEPNTVIGSFVTHKFDENTRTGNAFGVDMRALMAKVSKLILVGNTVTHADNPLMKDKHDALYFDWLITRANDQSKNRIFVWKKGN